MNQGQVLAPYHSNARALGALQGLFQSVESVLPAGAEGTHPQQARLRGVRFLVAFVLVFVVPAELFGPRVGEACICAGQSCSYLDVSVHCVFLLISLTDMGNR